jgi:hypothetical protein
VLFGIAGLALAKTWEGAQTYLLGSGIVYAALLVYGIVVKQGSDANFVPFNNGDDWLHGFLAVGLLAAWFFSRSRDRELRRDRVTTTAA